MRKYTGIIILFAITAVVYAQDQSINGKLTVTGNVVLKTTQSPTPFGELGAKLHFGTISENSDDINFSRVNIQRDHSELRLRLGDDGSEKFVIGFISYVDQLWKGNIVLKANGRIGIGVSDPACALDVNGTIRSKEVKIEATGWSDFVFDKNYDLPKLSEVEKHINEKQHLPGIPSQKEVLENGISVGEMQARLLQKIEELTLYVIEQDKKIEILQKENTSIKNELVNLKDK